MTDYQKPYDERNPLSIESYAKKLIGRTFRDVLQKNINTAQETGTFAFQTQDYYESQAAKGSLGHLLEEHYFHYTINSDSAPDFEKAGVELKATPFKQNKNKSYSAKERLVITLIDYMNVIDEPFSRSHLKDKSSLILLVYYQYFKELSKLDYPIKFVQLYQIPEEDMGIIQDDYITIINKIKAGKAHELSEGDTYYLGACTKGATAATSIRKQPFSDIPAKQRAFCFKTSYMTYILNKYIIPGKKTYEKLNYTGNFENHILSSINHKIGCTVSDLKEEYGISYQNRPKNLESSIVFRILGLKSNRAEEFIKSGIVVKTIRLEPDEDLVETVSFPTFDFVELVNETWENAEINNYLSETKFLFVVFKKDTHYKSFKDQKDFAGMDSHLSLYYSAFWNMPVSDIETDVKSVWERTRKIIAEGIKTEKHGSRIFNNLPKSYENRVCHIRPHGLNKNDTLPLPSGGTFTKQAFFLNAFYIRDEIMKIKWANPLQAPLPLKD